MPTISPFCDGERIKRMLLQIAVFGGLDETQLELTFGLLGKLVYDEGEIIFRKGESSQFIYIIESGAVELRIGEGETMMEKAVLQNGACFGEASFIGIHRHSATARCLTRSEILTLSRSAFLELQHRDLRLFSLLILNLARELARRLQMNDRILLHHHLGGSQNGPPVAVKASQ